MASGDPGILRTLCLARDALIHALKLQAVARGELPELPQVCGDDDEGADEPAERRAIGSQDDGHVTREVDRSDGIGIVVNIRGVQPRFTPVSPGPLRLGANEAHTRAIGVVVHLPTRAEDDVDVRAREEVRRSVRPIEHAHAPAARQRGLQPSWQVAVEPRDWLRLHAGARAVVQNVAGGEIASGMSAEAPEREGRATAEISGLIEPTAE